MRCGRMWPFNQSTYVKIDRRASGLVGVTVKERAVKFWANGHNLFNELFSELENLTDHKNDSLIKHREEGPGIIKADQLDRKKLQNTLKKCIYPLAVETHKNSSILVNIFTGEEVGEDVNVNKPVEIGHKKIMKFCYSLPQGFRE